MAQASPKVTMSLLGLLCLLCPSSGLMSLTPEREKPWFGLLWSLGHLPVLGAALV